jgi:DSF synthase
MNAIADVRFLSQAQAQFDQLKTRFEPEFGVYWATMAPHPRPCFNPQLLLELRSFIDNIVDTGGRIRHDGAEHTINYAVLASQAQGAFNLGGDLALFRSAILNRDREQLTRYAKMCVDDLYPWNRNFDLPITTISLVQGNALGGGFEAALASTVVIAEESARMGFPEVLFNLFPGMGAYSFLQRKVGRRITEELITSGNTYTAKQLYDMGVVDVVTPDGTGDAAVYGYVRKHFKAGNGRRAFERVRRDFEAVTRDELEHVTAIWVDAAMKLTERDLKMMDRLVRAQGKHEAAERTVEVAAAARPVELKLAVGGND